MRTKYFLILIIGIAIISCSSENNNGRLAEVPFFENALTLELTFGDDDISLPEDYLLAKPNGLVVKDNGNMLVADEYWMKEYDPLGNPVSMFGGKGQGPGEFEAPMRPTVSPTGYITVMNILWEYNVYEPDNDFIKKTAIKTDPLLKKHYDDEDLNFSMMEAIYSLNETERIIGLFGQDMEIEGDFPVFKYLLHETSDTLVTIAKYHSMGSIKNKNGGGSNSIDYQGDFHFGLLNNNKVVYTETYYDVEKNEEGSKYILHIRNIYNDKISQIKVDFQPVTIPGPVKELKPYENKRINLHIPVDPRRQSILDKTEFFPPIKELITDKNLIFVFLPNPKNEELEKIEDENDDDEDFVLGEEYLPYKVDIIDIEAGRIVARAEFSFIPDIIKNGYAYRLLRPDDAFPTVEKYKIDVRLFDSGY